MLISFPSPPYPCNNIIALFISLSFSGLIITEFRQFPDVRKVALEKLYLSFEELAKIKSHNPNSDSNIYFKGLSAKELRDKSQQFKALLDKDNAAK